MRKLVVNHDSFFMTYMSYFPLIWHINFDASCLKCVRTRQKQDIAFSKSIFWFQRCVQILISNYECSFWITQHDCYSKDTFERYHILLFNHLTISMKFSLKSFYGCGWALFYETMLYVCRHKHIKTINVPKYQLIIEGPCVFIFEIWFINEIFLHF